MASTHAFFKRYGANRLLKLALILNTADAVVNAFNLGRDSK